MSVVGGCVYVCCHWANAVVVVDTVIKAKYVIAVVFVINKNEEKGKIAGIRRNVRDPCTRCRPTFQHADSLVPPPFHYLACNF